MDAIATRMTTQGSVTCRHDRTLGTNQLEDSHFQLPIRHSSANLRSAEEDSSVSEGVTVEASMLDDGDDSTNESWEHVSVIRTHTVDGSESDTAAEISGSSTQPWSGDFDDFHNAIERGDLEATKAMLDRGTNPNRGTDDGITPLVLGMRKFNSQMVTLLLSRGADPHREVDGLAPMFHAVLTGVRASEFMVLLLDSGAYLHATYGPGYMSTLHWAAMHGMIHAASFLIAKGLSVDGACAQGMTPLKLAAENGHTMMIKLLLTKGADLQKREHDGSTLLMWAARAGRLEVVKYLLEQGIGVDDHDSCQLTALSVASRLGHLDVVKFLIEKGANVNVTSSWPIRLTPAMSAAASGHTEVLRALINHGADLTPVSMDGQTITKAAMKAGHIDVVRLLLETLGGPDYPRNSVALEIAMAKSQATMRSLMTTVSLMYRHINPSISGVNSFHCMRWVLDHGGSFVRPYALSNMLQTALFDEDLHMAEQLLKLGGDPNQTLETGATPLNLAVSRHNYGLVSALLGAGADPAKPSQSERDINFTPLYQAVLLLKSQIDKDIALIDILLASKQCKLLKGVDSQATPFSHILRHFGCWDKGLAELIALRMLDSIPNMNEDRSSDGTSLMHVAVTYEKKEIIDVLRQKKADMNVVGKDGQTPFLMACRGQPEMLNFLITRCADPHAVDAYGQGALHAAAAFGRVETLEFLLNLGPIDEKELDIDAVDYLGRSALIYAIEKHQEHTALRLIELGASFTITTMKESRNALHYAASKSMPQVIESILSRPNTNVNVQDDKGWTPLALACKALSPASITVLLSHGANPNITTSSDELPLHIALQRHHGQTHSPHIEEETILTLLNHGVDVSIPDAKNRAPLHLATQNNSLRVVKILLAKGAAPNPMNNNLQTPLSICSNPFIAQSLIDHGANVNHTEPNGYTPLHHAFDNYRVETFAVLVKAGADLGARNRIGAEMSVQERMDDHGGWESWAEGEFEFKEEDSE